MRTLLLSIVALSGLLTAVAAPEKVAYPAGYRDWGRSCGAGQPQHILHGTFHHGVLAHSVVHALLGVISLWQQRGDA